MDLLNVSYDSDATDIVSPIAEISLPIKTPKKRSRTPTRLFSSTLYSSSSSTSSSSSSSFPSSSSSSSSSSSLSLSFPSLNMISTFRQSKELSSTGSKKKLYSPSFSPSSHSVKTEIKTISKLTDVKSTKCPHGKKSRCDCVICWSCVHGVIKRRCTKCNDCGHGNLRCKCKVCNGCMHGKLLPKCAICKNQSRKDAMGSEKLKTGTISLTCPACTYINIGSSIECDMCLFPLHLHA
jgi:hypothetical protein